MRVILADDHRIVREGLRWMLDGEPAIDIVGEADSGAALLELVERVPADIVLLDVRMPGMSGLEALERLRERGHGVRVVIMSMHDEPAYLRRAVELGASGYVLKRASRADLVLALQVVAGGRAYIQGELAAVLVREVAGKASAVDAPQLTSRECDVLALVAEGFGTRQIARRLGISESTVKTHLRDIFERLEVVTRAEAVAVALREGLIE